MRKPNSPSAALIVMCSALSSAPDGTTKRSCRRPISGPSAPMWAWPPGLVAAIFQPACAPTCASSARWIAQPSSTVAGRQSAGSAAIVRCCVRAAHSSSAARSLACVFTAWP
jgi:hypothetical protein